MRDQAQIEAAIRHLEESLPTVASIGRGAAERTLMLTDILRWVLNRPSKFGVIFETCQRIDRAKRQ